MGGEWQSDHDCCALDPSMDQPWMILIVLMGIDIFVSLVLSDIYHSHLRKFIMNLKRD